MHNNPLPRLDISPELSSSLLPYCRLKPGDIWLDSVHGHRVGCLDAGDQQHVSQIMQKEQAQLAIQDPPYNAVAFKKTSLEEYMRNGE